MEASRIYHFFHKINLSTTTGIKTFYNALIGLDDEERYNVIQDSITKHIQAGKYQGSKYGRWYNIAIIETSPRVHLSVYDYPGLITKQIVETASQAIWTIVNDANIQHCIRSKMMCLYHRTSTTDKALNAIKNQKLRWEKEGNGYGLAFICYLYNTSKGTNSSILNIIGKMNIFLSEHEGHDITKINNWFESCQYDIEKNGRQKDHI